MCSGLTVKHGLSVTLLLEAVYLDLLWVRGEALDLADGLPPPQHQRLTVPLAGHAADVHPLQEVDVDLPDLGGSRHPPVTAHTEIITSR